MDDFINNPYAGRSGGTYYQVSPNFGGGGSYTVYEREPPATSVHVPRGNYPRYIPDRNPLLER